MALSVWSSYLKRLSLALLALVLLMASFMLILARPLQLCGCTNEAKQTTRKPSEILPRRDGKLENQGSIAVSYNLFAIIVNCTTTNFTPIRHRMYKTMKYLLVISLSTMLTGCIATSGTTEYTIKPIETASGELVCCEATVYNSKDYESLKFKFKKLGDGSYDVELDEKGVSASDPAQIQAESNSELIDMLLKSIPAAGGN